MNIPWKWAGAGALVLAVLISPAHAGMLDGLGQKIQGHIADRLGGSADNATSRHLPEASSASRRTSSACRTPRPTDRPSRW